MKKSLLWILVVVIAATMVVSFSLAGCKAEAPAEEAAEAKKPEDIKLGYICKMLTHPWFIQEDWGCQQKCDELGVQYEAVDTNLDDEENMAAIENFITREFDGIAVVTPNIGQGAAISRKCEEAGVAFILIDSATEEDEDGNIIPMVEMPSFDGGVMGGEALAEIAKERGFFDEGNIVKVLAIDIPTINVVHDRAMGINRVSWRTVLN